MSEMTVPFTLEVIPMIAHPGYQLTTPDSLTRPERVALISASYKQGVIPCFDTGAVLARKGLARRACKCFGFDSEGIEYSEIRYILTDAGETLAMQIR
tara:strand:+ start:535 stop:828 length:294 start_codon:yes stop_codon:yes gene_type:complete